MNDVVAKTSWPPTAEAWLARVDRLAPRIEAAAAEAERARRLPESLMVALHAEGLFRLLLPREFGGAEVSPPVFFRIVEALARYDASTSWCVCQGNGCAMMAAYLDAPVAEAIWGRDPRAVLCWGQGPARADVVDGGYRVTATASFVSGGRHATWFGAHCAVIERDGTARLRPDGMPETRTVLFSAQLAPMKDNWDVLGLRGTGSDSISVADLFVREDHTIVREAPDMRCNRPLYLYSQMGIYALGFAGTALGIARAFVDAFKTLAHEKRPRLVATTLADSPVAQDELARAEARLEASREFLLGAAERMWSEVAASNAIRMDQRMRIRLAATHAIQEAKAVVDALYDIAGTNAIFAASPFERRFRDMHMVAQQIQGRKTHFQVVGAWMLGHPADLSVT
jgi:alkylation response protein AidB-like acyl-CoA dehydrogenase